jgi:hypothetical protein
MKRREFIALLAISSIAGPGAAIAQQPKTYRIGLLSALAPPSDTSPFIAPLIRGLESSAISSVAISSSSVAARKENSIAYHSLPRNWSRARLMLPWSPGFLRRLQYDKRPAFRQWPSRQVIPSPLG